MNVCPVSVAIPTYKRVDKLLEALRQIQACNPCPSDIIVHIDADDRVTEAAILNSSIKDIFILKSEIHKGPGGGRNLAIASAKNEIVASFDDDSYPIDSDYFSRLLHLFEQFPKAAILGAAIYHIGEPIQPDELTAQWEHSFVGCGCAYRKSVFQTTTGYVAMPVAYGMEEVDLSLRLHSADWGVLVSPWLRVFHNSQLAHHNSAKITAASIYNQALLAYLRYPPALWWIGLYQCISRIVWLVKHQRYSGIAQGVLGILGAVQQHQSHRQTVSSKSLHTFLNLKRRAVAAEVQSGFRASTVQS